MNNAQWLVDTYGFRHFEDLVGVHAGPIFILGSGPSINGVDFAQLHRYPKFGVNQVGHPSGARKDIEVNFWTSKDMYQCADFCRDSAGDTRGIVMAETIIKRLSPYEEMGRVADRCFVPWRYKGCIISSLNYEDNGILGNTTSVSPAIHCAMLMGFDPIFLVGVDLGWSNGAPTTHCYQGRDPVIPSDQWSKPDGAWMTSSNYQTMARHLNQSAERIKRMGRTVINCSPHSSETLAFPTRTLDEVLDDLRRDPHVRFDPYSGRPAGQAPR